jgi:predicted ABC-type ATPase
MPRPTLVVIAGPNGSGKSSLIGKLQGSPDIHLGTYINADDIELGLKRIVDPQARSREAQKQADALRADCLARKSPFSFETVMSHPSKIELMSEARRLGYSVSLYFVAVDDPLLNIQRVQVRVSQGGHSVPEDRIVSRYRRTLALLPRALIACDDAVLFDNTAAGQGPTPAASAFRIGEGFQFEVLNANCGWLRRELLSHLPFSGLLTGQVTSALVPEAVLRSVDLRRTAGLAFP